jgi:hypothetical protein
MTKFTSEDKESILQQWNDTIRQFREDYDRWEKHTLKEYILRCAEIAERQVEAKLIDIPTTGISSYLFKKLNEEGIKVSDKWIQEILPQNFKRNYSESELTSELKKKDYKTIYEDVNYKLEADDTGHYKINDVEVTPKPATKTYEDSQENKDVLLPNEYIKYYARVAQNLKQTLNIINRIIDKTTISKDADDIRRSKAKDNVKNIKEGIGDLAKLMKEEREREAELIYIIKLIDDREMVGKFEKIKAVLLDACLYNTAKVAKLLQITPKHMAANIKNREFPELHENMKQWFRVIDVEINGKREIIDLADWFESQYIRKELSLDIRNPFVTKYKAD